MGYSSVRGLNYADTAASTPPANQNTRNFASSSSHSTYASSMYSTSSAHASSALDSLQQTRRSALDRLKGWRKSTAGPPKPSTQTPVLGTAAGAGPQITLQPLQCKPNAREEEPLQQRDITDPRSLAYHANKYTVSDNASIIRRHRPDQRSRNQRDPNLNSSLREDTFNDSLSYRSSSTAAVSRPATALGTISSNTHNNNRLSVLSSYSLTPTPAPPSAAAQSIPSDSPRPRQSSFSIERPSTANVPHSPDLSIMSTMQRTNTNSSTRSRTSYLPANPVSAWDDDEDDSRKRGLFNRFKSSRSISSRKASTSSTAESIRPSSAQAPSIRSVSTKSVKSGKTVKPAKAVKPAKTAKPAKPVKSKTSRGNISNKFGIDDLGDFEWNMHGYMEGDEEGSDAEIEAALKRVREAEANENASNKETTPTPTSSSNTTSTTTTTSRTTTTHSTPTPESAAVSTPSTATLLSTSSKVSPVLPPISPSRSLDLGLDSTITTTVVPNERFENEFVGLKPTASPNYARDHVANLLRRRANSGQPQTPAPQTPVPQVAPEQCPWDTWKYTSNHHTYQITPPDSTRSSHVYASADHYDTSHHSMVLPESPVQLQPMSSTSSSSSDQTKWDDISANIAMIQQQIQEMSPRSRELARGFAAKELTKPATLITPTTISPATFVTPPRPSRDNVELPDAFSKSFLTMTSSPSVRPLPRRINNKLGPALEESDASPDSSQRSSVSTRLSTAPSSPEPDMRCFA